MKCDFVKVQKIGVRWQRRSGERAMEKHVTTQIL